MKKRYCFGGILLLMPVALLIIMATGMISPEHIGMFLIRGGIASLVALYYGITFIRKGYAVSKKAKNG